MRVLPSDTLAKLWVKEIRVGVPAWLSAITADSFWPPLSVIVLSTSGSLVHGASEVQGGEVELDRTVIESLADPVTHLVRNAVEAMGTRGGKITVRVAKRAPASAKSGKKGDLLIDTGMGRTIDAQVAAGEETKIADVIEVKHVKRAKHPTRSLPALCRLTAMISGGNQLGSQHGSR